MNIRDIRRYLNYKIGSKIIIIYYGGRNRKEKYVGVLYKTFNHIFSIKINDKEIKCFNYSDILTKTIQIYI